MDELLTTADVANLLGVKPGTIRLYRTSSRPGGRYEQHPFPSPDDHVGINPVWRATRKGQILAWAATRVGQGAGGGQPAHKRQLHHRDGYPRNNEPGNLEVRDQPEA